MKKKLPAITNDCKLCKLGLKVLRGELSFQKIFQMTIACLAIVAAIVNLCVAVRQIRTLLKD